MNGGSGGVKPVPFPYDITSVGGQKKAIFPGSSFSFLNDDGTTGPTGMTELLTGITFGSTGGGSVLADQIKQSDGTYKSLAQTPMSSMANATDADTAANFGNIIGEFRSLTSTAAISTQAKVSANAIGVTGNANVGGALGVTGAATFRTSMELTTGATFVSDVPFAKSIALSGAGCTGDAGINYETNGTVDLNGTLTTSYATQLLPHMHGTFIWTRFTADSNTGSTSTLGYGITSTDDVEVNRSIPIGGAAADARFMDFTIGAADDGAHWDVGDTVGVYKVTLHAVVGNSAVNPAMTLNIKRNGTDVHTVVNNSYSVISPQSMSMEWVGAVRGTWPITVDCDASTGNATLKAGTTLSIVRIA